MQVTGVGADDKRGVTICLTTRPDGKVLPVVIIYEGVTEKVLSSAPVKELAEAYGHVLTMTKVKHANFPPMDCCICRLQVFFSFAH